MKSPGSRVQSWPCPWLHRAETSGRLLPRIRYQFPSVGKAGAPWWWSQPVGLTPRVGLFPGQGWGAARPPPSSSRGWSSLKEEVGKQEGVTMIPRAPWPADAQDLIRGGQLLGEVRGKSSWDLRVCETVLEAFMQEEGEGGCQFRG